jgi:hypothetical protein
MRHHYLLSILSLGIPIGFFGMVEAAEKPNTERAPGLIATYENHPADDGTRGEISQVVLLPELGLAAGESPHPAIKPAFTVEYRGKLLIVQPGKYKFDYKGSVTINGKVVEEAIALDAGDHDLSLKYQRPDPAGKVAVGFSWQSEHFIKEPVPPTALWHQGELASQKNPEGSHPSPPHRIAQTMKQMKCASCHDGNFLTTMHHKFAPDALMIHMRHANPMKWYGAMTGPQFKKDETLVQLVKDLQKLPRPERRHKPSKGEVKGLKMIGAKAGFACIACHDIKHHRTAAESKGPNLAYITQRVSYDWFVRWMHNPQRLQPGVPMPAFFAGQKPAERQANIDALWDYLLQGKKMPLPEELRADPAQFILKPKDKPLVNRVYLRLSDKRELLRAICVGFPNGMSYCFDAETCQLVYVWTGGYIDMTDHWKNQSLHPVATVGNSFLLSSEKERLQIGDHAPVFRGYEMVGGIPRFEFSYGDTKVHLTIDAPSPDQIRQNYIIGKRSDPVKFVGPPAGSTVSMKASAGKLTGNNLTISESGEVKLTLTLKKGE